MRAVAGGRSEEETGKVAETEHLDGAGWCQYAAVYKRAGVYEGRCRDHSTRGPQGSR